MEILGFIGMFFITWIALESIAAIGYLAINGFKF